MKIYYKEKQNWTESGSLRQLLSLKAASLFCNSPYVMAIVGAGGKTSLIRRLAAEGREQGVKVLVTTTVHMFRPSRFGVFSKEIQDAKAMLGDHGIAVVGEPVENGKIRFPGEAFYKAVCPLADLVLVEADGSKGLPLKVPGPGEPVIPYNADVLLCVSGLSALGQSGEDIAFRLEQVKQTLGEFPARGYEGESDREWRITPEIMASLMLHGYLEPLRKELPEVKVLPVFNQGDTPELSEAGKAILEAMGETEGFVTGQIDVGEGSSLF